MAILLSMFGRIAGVVILCVSPIYLVHVGVRRINGSGRAVGRWSPLAVPTFVLTLWLWSARKSALTNLLFQISGVVALAGMCLLTIVYWFWVDCSWRE